MMYTECHRGGCRFRVWAPEHRQVSLRLYDRAAGRVAGAGTEADRAAGPGRTIVLQKDAAGYFHADVAGIGDGDRYHYFLDDVFYPDPASASQPDGVYGPSAVVDHRLFMWNDASWHVPPFAQLIFYELHVGTFTPEGTFDAIIPRLGELALLGINALELMPVAACSGARNWGYDGVFLYAVQHDYGGPGGLKRLVAAAHAHGIAVFLDVVYNHLGTEGNCLEAFGPYFTAQYHTPWGKAINYDGAWSDGVRAFIAGNAVYWAEHFHIDGLRLDAIHEIYDRNAVSIWDDLHALLGDWEQRSGRRCYLVAESDANDPRVVRPASSGGRGFDAQWMDDFHHCLYVLLHPSGWKNYKDFGGVEQLAKAYMHGFVHTGEYLRFRHRRHGASAAGIPGERFVVFNQNHDLPGNRPGGERLSRLVDTGTLKLAAAVVLLSPYIPMLFMGEEYGEDAPFFFFSDYHEPATSQGQVEGRRQQFAAFGFEGEVRDPQDPFLFEQSKLHWKKRGSGDHRLLLEWHRELIRLRRTHPLLADLSKRFLRADVLGPLGLSVYRYSAAGDRHLVCLYNFSNGEPLTASLGYAVARGGTWRRLLSSGAAAVDSDSSQPVAAPPEVRAGGMVRLPPRGVAVYELNLSPVSPAPVAE
ncbi:MAG TPA: malto-oligosyltrehalose trehalohydrolase [Puia sp.]|nr:malto-oligosyltrehalose trehalohydrolase [Puia sp.]